MQQANTPETIFGYEGDGGLGDRLITAVLAGRKVATSSLAVQYLSGDPLPRVGEHRLLTDHSGQVHARLETTRVEIIPLHLVTDEVAHDEGEGFRDAAEWRAEHVRFWQEIKDSIRNESGDARWALRDSEPVVVEWFRVLEGSACREG